MSNLEERVKKLEDKIRETEIREDERKRIRSLIFNGCMVLISFVCMLVTIYATFK